MTNRDFGRKVITEVQKILGIYVLRARDINSKLDVAKAIVKICEEYAKKKMILLENAGAINPVKESQLNLYESLARETKKQNEALTKENEILKKDLELYKAIAQDYKKKANDHQKFYIQAQDKYYNLFMDFRELAKENEDNRFYFNITIVICVLTMILGIASKWW